MTESTADDLNRLRSMLHSDVDLEIRISGDFHQVCCKLQSDIQISFFIDPSTKSLTINNLHDLRIEQLSNRRSLQQNEWIYIRDYFNQLIDQSNSNTSLHSILQLIQEELSKPMKSISISNEEPVILAQTSHGADLIFDRIAHDPSIDCSKVLIGYEDHFTGIHEIPFNDFKKVHEDDVSKFFGLMNKKISFF